MITSEDFALSLNSYFKMLNSHETIDPFKCPDCTWEWWRVVKKNGRAKLTCKNCGYERNIKKKDFRAYMVER